MTSRQRAAPLGAALLIVSLLGACGGSAGEPAIKPITDTPSSTAAAPDPDGFTPEQRAVADTIQKWNTVAFSVSTDAVGPAIEPLVTPRVLDAVVKAEAGQQAADYLGDVTLDVQTVTVSGDTATAQGCRDGAQAYRVKKGDTEAGIGSSRVGTTKLTIGLIRRDGTWLIDDPKGEQVRAC